MKILINGATGFVGSCFVRHFASQSYDVLASGRSAAPAALLNLARYQRADICRSMTPVQADAVVHVAALASDSASFAQLLAANVEGTKQLFYATSDCPVFIYISSSSVYDNQTAEHREDELCDDYQRLSPYGRSKRLAEDWLLQQDWSRRTLIILRPRAVYGPGDRLLLPRLMRLVRGGRILRPGSMQISCSLTYIGNLAASVQAALVFTEMQPGGAHIFNVADAEPYKLREVVNQLLSAVYGRELPVLELPLAPLKALAVLSEYLPGASALTRFGLSAVSQSCVLNLEKSKQLLGYNPVENLWSVLPALSAWVNRVGLGAVRTGRADLPWAEGH